MGMYAGYTAITESQIKKLLEQKFIAPIENNARIYTPNFAQSYLIRGVIEALRNNEFIGGLE